ncbi:hypothetical protein TWF506_007196 [Arthrobotrys conoides]|uniref:Uncharacterized protein n=1 Tax=Arthrobotrys conoides TaxID=74498 RepID=A0AAN8NNR9_9PEZI
MVDWMDDTIDNVKAKIQDERSDDFLMETMKYGTEMQRIIKEGSVGGRCSSGRAKGARPANIIMMRCGSGNDSRRHRLNGKTITLDTASGYSQIPDSFSDPTCTTSATSEKSSPPSPLILSKDIPKTDEHCYSTLGYSKLLTIGFPPTSRPFHCGVDDLDWLQVIVTNLLYLRRHVLKVIDNVQEVRAALTAQYPIDLSRPPYSHSCRAIWDKVYNKLHGQTNPSTIELSQRIIPT